MKKNASSSGGWSGKGKATQEKKKSQRNDAERTKLDHYLFIGGIGPLEEKDFHDHWTNDGLKYIDVMKPTSHCVAVFQNSATVRHLVEKKYESIKGRICVTQPYFVYNDDESYFAREKHRIDEELHQLEESAQPLSPNSSAVTKPAGIKVTEEKGKLPNQLIPGGKYEFQLKIKNSTTSPKFVSKVTAVPLRKEFSYEIKPKSNAEDSVSIVSIKFNPKSFGVFKQLIYLQFDNKKLQMQHELQLVVSPTEDELKKLGSSLFQFKSEKLNEEILSNRSVISPPSLFSTLNNNSMQPLEIYISQIEDYPLPLEMESLHNNNNVNSKNKTNNNNNSTNLKENHRNRLHQLLWSEELQELKESKESIEGIIIRDFEINSDSQLLNFNSHFSSRLLSVSSSLFLVQLPIGSERKFEQLQLRDSIFVWNGIQPNVEYEGKVEFIGKSSFPFSLLVSFSEQIRSTFASSFPYQLRVGFKRGNKRILHKAVDLLDASLIWPESSFKVEASVKSGTTWAELANGKAKGIKPLERSLSEGNSQTTQRGNSEAMRFQGGKKWNRNELRFEDPEIANNEDQITAILNVLNRTNGMIPFLLHGGSGCGKSRTLAELVSQILITDEPNGHNRVLICAKTEKGVHNLLRTLSKKWPPSMLFRFQAYPTCFNVPDDLQNYSRYDADNDVYAVPSVEELKSFKIIVSTIGSVGALHGFGLGRDHFSHILVDDAAKITEPEAVAAISFGSCQRRTAVVLAGDDKQIGPVTKIGGPTCKSIMERLASLSDVFGERSNPTPSFSIELKENYVNHSSIVSYLSTQFYSGKMKGGDISPLNQTFLQNWTENLNCEESFPFFFQAVEGKDDREGDSPSSFFNLSEAFTILHILTCILKKNNCGIAENEVGVVSSFPNQATKIAMLLKLHGLPQVKVGILDEFQEESKKLMLVSTVRSGVKHLPSDRRYSLGFLQDSEKKINFCLSRSISTCILIGDPFILSQDATWRSFFEYLQANKTYLGPILTPEFRKAELEKREAQEEELLAQEKLSNESKLSSSSSESFSTNTNTSLTSVGKSVSMDSIASKENSPNFPVLKSARSHGNSSNFLTPSQGVISSPTKIAPTSPNRSSGTSPKGSAVNSNTPTPNSSVVGSLFPTELEAIENFLPVSALHDEDDGLVLNNDLNLNPSHSVIGSNLLGSVSPLESSTNSLLEPSSSKLDPFRKSESFGYGNHNYKNGESFNRTQEPFMHGSSNSAFPNANNRRNSTSGTNSIDLPFHRNGGGFGNEGFRGEYEPNFGAFRRSEDSDLNAFGLNDFHLTPVELGLGALIGPPSFPGNNDYLDQTTSPTNFSAPSPNPSSPFNSNFQGTDFFAEGTNGTLPVGGNGQHGMGEEYEALCQIENYDLLYFKKGLGVPPLHVTRKGGHLWIEISCFKVHPSIQRNGHSVTISFFREEDRNQPFSANTLFSTGRVFLPNSKGIASTDAWLFERNNSLQSQLILSIPSYCNPAWVEVGVNAGSVVITMPPLRTPYFSPTF